MAAPLSATKTASASEIRSAKSSITQKGSGSYEKNGVSDFFDTLMSDIKNAFTGPEDRNYGSGYEYKTPREKRYDAQRENESYYANLNDDSPRAVRKPKKKKKPIKTVDQFYAELSNKNLWGALPSLGMERGNSTAPRYGKVELKQREGGVVRSLFNPYGE